MSSIRIALCQINPVVGDLAGNTDQIIGSMQRAEAEGVDLAVFPELAITGYPPEDLLLKPRFIEDSLTSLQRIAESSRSCVSVIGFVDRSTDLHNAAAICHEGGIVGTYRKRVLPNYGVFDEQRYFAPGTEEVSLYRVAGIRVGISICEDAWSPSGPIPTQANGGAELMLSLNASPYYAGKVSVRERMISTRAVDASVPIVYVNQVGGQDELIFDGASMAVDAEGRVVARANQFTEEILFVGLDVRPSFRKRLLDPRGRAPMSPLRVVDLSGPRDDVTAPPVAPAASPLELDPEAEIYSALVLGARDYVAKNGFTDVVSGLSGGIDSALVAAIAVDALGSDHVHAVSMPSRYSSDGSRLHAAELAANLGIEMTTVEIDDAHTAFESLLSKTLAESPRGLTDENLQSRIRGVTLMALSNEHNWLVLTTGNKSELAVGYSTLYGDTAGGFAVIKDVAKTKVFELCRWRNEQGKTQVIPEIIISKPPSAELRPDQRDDQSLPPYEILDPILEAYVEDDLTSSEIEALGFEAELVRKVIRMVDLAEYKRRQSPLGVRVTPKAFGKDRRVPITNRYRS